MYLLQFPYKIAEYSCPLINPPSQKGLFENKIHNIRVAISRFSPPALEPGEEFSFWHYARAPIAENDYREGAMFINHQVTTSLGGGLCQLSGLIYNLALLSGCKIIERYNHSIDAYGEDRYIPLGRDATVAFGRKNLRFSNPHKHPIYFDLNVDTSRAWGSVMSPIPLETKIHIETRLISTLPSPHRKKANPTIQPGQTHIQPGLTGKVVKAWRVFETPEQGIRKEFLSCDRYAATPNYTNYHASNFLWIRKWIDRLGQQNG